MKKHLILLIAISTVLAGCGAGNLDQGQVKYTPGVPPWQEKDGSKKGPGGAPGGGGPGSAAPESLENTTQAPPGGGPPGMTAPERGMGKQ